MKFKEHSLILQYTENERKYTEIEEILRKKIVFFLVQSVGVAASVVIIFEQDIVFKSNQKFSTVNTPDNPFCLTL